MDCHEYAGAGVFSFPMKKGFALLSLPGCIVGQFVVPFPSGWEICPVRSRFFKNKTGFHVRAEKPLAINQQLSLVLHTRRSSTLQSWPSVVTLLRSWLVRLPRQSKMKSSVSWRVLLPAFSLSIYSPSRKVISPPLLFRVSPVLRIPYGDPSLAMGEWILSPRGRRGPGLLEHPARRRTNDPCQVRRFRLVLGNAPFRGVTPSFRYIYMYIYIREKAVM